MVDFAPGTAEPPIADLGPLVVLRVLFPSDGAAVERSACFCFCSGVFSCGIVNSSIYTKVQADTVSRYKFQKAPMESQHPTTSIIQSSIQYHTALGTSQKKVSTPN